MINQYVERLISCLIEAKALFKLTDIFNNQTEHEMKEKGINKKINEMLD